MNTYTVIVTGAHGELGRVVTERLEQQHWTVLPWTQSLVDLTDPIATQRAFDVVVQPIHAIVHCVGGIIAGRPLQEMTDDDFRTMIDLNMRTTFNVLRCGVPRLAETRGAVVTIAAMSAHHASPFKSLYAASKAGVVAMTLAVAEEGRTTGVRAMCISPSIIDTPSNRSWSTPAERTTWISPERIADEIYHCIDPTSSQSGAVIMLDGTPERSGT